MFDPERGEVPGCLREGVKRDLFIALEFLKELKFDSHGLAVVWSTKEGWMYANRKGKVVVSETSHVRRRRMVPNQHQRRRSESATP
jgi:hypothetical protein